MATARLLSVLTLALATIPIALFDNSAISVAEVIHFVSPGQDSELVSPIHLAAELPLAGGAIRVELHGQDGQLLARRLLAPIDEGHLELDIPFEISADSQAATLLVSLEDEYDRMQEVASIEVTLLAEGESTQRLADAGQIVIEAPVVGQSITGGTVTVAGTVSGLDAGPLLVQLITRSGRVLASQDVYATLGDGEKRSFEVELDYALRNAEWARLSVAMQRNGVIVLLRSVEVQVAP